MPELRRDPITGTWSIIASERGKRPTDFIRHADIKKEGVCPFCYGNESLTPPEVLAYRENGQPNTPGWKTRVVPNKFPALERGYQKLQRKDGIYESASGVGVHEVVVESPDHNSSLGTHSIKQLELIIRTLIDRYNAIAKEPVIRYVQIFKNAGYAAGASLEHTHFQIIAVPIVPPAIEAELRGALDYHSNNGRCIYCDIIKQEKESSERVIEESPHFLAFCPYPSRMPYEFWLIPLAHRPDFARTGEDEVADLALILHNTIQTLERVFENPPYNLMIHTSPLQHNGRYHWHIEILPRLVSTAGFEWGTGCYINPTPPELAASILRRD